jgi:hypothetical protein
MSGRPVQISTPYRVDRVAVFSKSWPEGQHYECGVVGKSKDPASFASGELLDTHSV